MYGKYLLNRAIFTNYSMHNHSFSSFSIGDIYLPHVGSARKHPFAIFTQLWSVIRCMHIKIKIIKHNFVFKQSLKHAKQKYEIIVWFGINKDFRIIYYMNHTQIHVFQNISEN